MEALRQHLGLDRIRLFGHSAGGTLAILYATRYPQHVKELVLVAPSPRVVGIDVTDDDRRAVAFEREDEPWFAEAIKSFEEIWAGNMTPEAFKGIAPFWHGRWDDAARALDDHPDNEEAAREYYADGSLDPGTIRAALKTLDVPTLLVAGEYDVALPPNRAHEYAGCFANARRSSCSPAPVTARGSTTRWRSRHGPAHPVETGAEVECGGVRVTPCVHGRRARAAEHFRARRTGRELLAGSGRGPRPGI